MTDERRYTAADLDFTTVSTATPAQLTKLVMHVASLNEEADHEDPFLYLSWILEHGLRCPRITAEAAARVLLERTPTLSSSTLICAVVEQIRPLESPPGYLEPHQIYLAFDKVSQDLVDIAGFVPDDRDVGKHEKLSEKDPDWIGFFGGHNVNSKYRGRGIGPLMIQHRVEAIRRFVAKSWHKRATVYTFLTNAHSGRLLVTHGGFEYIGTWDIKYFNKKEEVFRLHFPWNT